MATQRTPVEPESVLDLPLPEGVSGYEFVDGKPVPVTPAGVRHGSLIMEVGVHLLTYIREHNIAGKVCSDSGIVMRLPGDPRRMRAPDVSFFSQETLQKHEDPVDRFARFLPDLAIEIDIASGRKPGGHQRIRDYLDAGIRLIWSIQPRTRSATVYRQDGSITELTEQEALDGEDVVPGFTLPLNRLYS